MEKVALLIEFKAGRVKKANFGMATLLRRAGKAMCAFLVNHSAAEAQAALAPYGVQQIVAVQAEGPGAAWNPALWASAIAAAMDRFGITQLVGLTTPQGRDLLPRIASQLDAPLVMDCIEVDLDRQVAKTSQYSGKAVATIQLSGRHFIYGLRANTVEAQKAPVAAELSTFKYTPDSDGSFEVLETRSGGEESLNLSEAEVIISGGRGMQGGENFRLLFECARLINGAAVGASRVAVDLGWVPYRMQVGQTGVKVNPKVYIACGISGSIQHFAGMKSSGMILAINTDPNAAILANCDYYAVADLFDVLPELKRQLTAFNASVESSIL
jgi:electron transfer flavoprotein alpha subunit